MSGNASFFGEVLNQVIYLRTIGNRKLLWAFVRWRKMLRVNLEICPGYLGLGFSFVWLGPWVGLESKTHEFR